MSLSQVAHEASRLPSARVPLLTRWRLQRASRADRRAGLPVGLSPQTTPMLRELVALYGHACERERTDYLVAESRLHIQLRRLDAQIDAFEAELARRAAEVLRLAHPTPEEWLTIRFPGEELLSTAATRTRRAVAHRRQLDEAKAVRDEAQQLVHDALADRSELQAQLQQRAEIARSRVQQHRERTERMAALYRRTLVKRHPEREQLITRWESDICVLPDWATGLAQLPSEVSTEMPA